MGSFTIRIFLSSWPGMATKSCSRVVYTDTVSIARYIVFPWRSVNFD